MKTVLRLLTVFGGPLPELITEGACDAARDLDARLLVFGSITLNPFFNLTPARAKEWFGLSNGRVDGFVFPFATPAILNYASELHAAGRPVVLVARRHDTIPFFQVDNRGAIRTVVDDLVSRGHRRIAFVRGPAGNPSAEERLAGFRAACVETGVELDERLIVGSQFDEVTSRAEIAKLLTKGLEFSAIIGADDLCAIGAMAAIRERGRSIPGDVEVIGFNNSIRAEASIPSLTSCDVPAYQLGYRAVESLLRHIRTGAPLTSADVPSRAVRRNSTRAPSALPAATEQSGSIMSRIGVPLSENQERIRLEALRELALRRSATEEQLITAAADTIRYFSATRFGLFLADDPRRTPGLGRFRWWYETAGRLNSSTEAIDLSQWDPGRYGATESGGLALMSLHIDDVQVGFLLVEAERSQLTKLYEIAGHLTVGVQAVRLNRELEQVHHELESAARAAGMADVATSVLHNVGNALNSVNVSSTLVVDGLQKMKFESLATAAKLLAAHTADGTEFLTQDPKGKVLPSFLASLAEHGLTHCASLRAEAESIRTGIEQIHAVISMQQTYSEAITLSENIQPASVAEEAIGANAARLSDRGITLHREFDATPDVRADRAKVLRILIDILQNAVEACTETTQPTKIVTIGIHARTAEAVQFSVQDNGSGIVPDDMKRLFGQGFTTKHRTGLALHSAAIAAHLMHGSLIARSDGPNRGATFILELPAA